MKNNLSKLGIEGNILKLMKDIYQKSMANSRCNNTCLEALLFKSEKNQEFLLFCHLLLELIILGLADTAIEKNSTHTYTINNQLENTTFNTAMQAVLWRFPIHTVDRKLISRPPHLYEPTRIRRESGQKCEHGIQMANKPMKKRLTPLVTKKVKPKTRHLKPINLVTVKKFGAA